jgi:hypothetical protein
MLERSVDDYFKKINFMEDDDLIVAETIRKAVSEFGAKEVVDYCQAALIGSIDFNINPIKYSIEMGVPEALVLNGRFNALSALFNAGFDVNTPVMLHAHPNDAEPIPGATNLLTVAFAFRGYDAVEFLLNHKIDVDLKLSACNALHLALNNIEMTKLITTHAFAQKCLGKLISEKNHFGYTPLDNVFNDNDTEVIMLWANLAIVTDTTLFIFKQWRDILFKLLSKILANPLDNVNDYIDCVKSISQVILLKNKSLRTPVKMNDEPRKENEFLSDINNQSQLLFGKIYKMEHVKTESDALKGVFAQISALLIDPAKCMPMLKIVNDELERYYYEKEGKPFPLLDEVQYFITLDRHEYPIPKRDSTYLDKTNNGKPKGLDKASTLKELLILLFKKYGLSGSAVKWVGFILEEYADNTVRQGNVIVESMATGALALHGAYSHMLQIAIILLAIDRGIIKTRYHDSEGNPQKITPQMMMSGLVNVKTLENNSAWQEILDTVTIDKVLFSSPYRLASIIMKEGKRYGMPVLATYLIDSCLKGLVNFYNSAVRLNPAIGTFYEFIDLISMHDIHYIINLPTQSKAAIQKYVKKYGAHNVIHPNSKHVFGLINGPYKPLEEFECNLTGNNHTLFSKNIPRFPIILLGINEGVIDVCVNNTIYQFKGNNISVDQLKDEVLVDGKIVGKLSDFTQDREHKPKIR